MATTQSSGFVGALMTIVPAESRGQYRLIASFSDPRWVGATLYPQGDFASYEAAYVAGLAMGLIERKRTCPFCGGPTPCLRES